MRVCCNYATKLAWSVDQFDDIEIDDPARITSIKTRFAEYKVLYLSG